ncbi:putative cell agglutination protein pfl4 [Paramyrothecium foliicola]|nr:putative cell agglutination protein pfl4 [Paramyrothecium foliicola]
MKLSLILAGFASIGAATDICQNNCGRAVAGTGRTPIFAVRSSLCSAFVTTTTTVTAPTTTVTGSIIYNRNVHPARAQEPRKIHVSAAKASAAKASAAKATAAQATAAQATAAELSAAKASAALVTAAAVTGEKPAYATACANAEAYWSACHCFTDIKATVVTVIVPGPTETLPGPVCTQGLEYAIYGPPSGSDRNRNLAEAATLGHQHVDFILQFSGVEPDVTGVTPSIGTIVQWDDDWTIPVQLYGNTGPAGSEMGLSMVAHRGHLLPAVAGLYTILLDTSDNAFYFWVGDVAVSDWTSSNSAVSRFWPPDSADPSTYTFEVHEEDLGKPLPFRFLWLNYGGPGAFSARIVDPYGSIVLGPETQKSPLLLSSCTGIDLAPSWVPWPEEI